MSRAGIFCIALILTVMSASTPAAQEQESADEKATDESAVRVRYDNGFVFQTRDQRFLLNLRAGLQLRYTFMDYDPTVVGNETDYSNFYVRRARLWLRGYLFDPRLTYFFNIQLEPSRDVNAHDLWITYRFSDLLNLGGGRNKIAYGLEMLNTGWGLEFVDRSLMYGETDIDLGSPETAGPRYPGGGTERFALYWEDYATGFATGGMTLYRSQGVQLSGTRGSQFTPTFEYQAGVWNGRGSTGSSNRDSSMLYAVRVGYHPWGWVDWFRQGDGENTHRYKLGVLLSAYSNSGKKVGGYDESGYNLAVMHRYRGFSTDMEWGVETFDYDRFVDDFEREGWRIASGYFIKERKIQVVARYATIQRLKDPSFQKAMESGLGVASLHDGEGFAIGLERRISEFTVGFNWFFRDWHQIALKTDASRLVREFAADPNATSGGEPSPIPKAPDQVDYRVRVMVQAYF